MKMIFFILFCLIVNVPSVQAESFLNHCTTQDLTDDDRERLKTDPNRVVVLFEGFGGFSKQGLAAFRAFEKSMKTQSGVINAFLQKQTGNGSQTDLLDYDSPLAEWQKLFLIIARTASGAGSGFSTLNAVAYDNRDYSPVTSSIFLFFPHTRWRAAKRCVAQIASLQYTSELAQPINEAKTIYENSISVVGYSNGAHATYLLVSSLPEVKFDHVHTYDLVQKVGRSLVGLGHEWFKNFKKTPNVTQWVNYYQRNGIGGLKVLKGQTISDADINEKKDEVDHVGILNYMNLSDVLKTQPSRVVHSDLANTDGFIGN